MKNLLRVLIVEDSEDDTLLLVRELSRAGYEVEYERVESAATMNEALNTRSWDLVISDFTLPHFDGMQALKILSDKGVDLPFIFVSGTLGEDVAVRAMRLGAKDYIIKGNLKRLVPAIQRELREAQSRQERRWADEECKRLEEELRQAQKMEGIGRLAGGVAHDFNNLLTVILGYTEMIQSRLSEDDPVRKETEQVFKAAERAASLTRQLLAFSRKQVLNLRVLNLNPAIADLQKMLERLIGEDVEIVTHLEPELKAVKADPGQFEQVILNLAVNARDAMPAGGTLTIETANVTGQQVRSHDAATVEPGPYVMVAVQDTGTGIEPQTLSLIFDPFFTTKAPGKGTGLGLSTVYGIVKQSGGHIAVESQPGQGATFRVYFPAVEYPEEIGVEPRGSSISSGGAETILLVEDEATLRRLLASLLQAKGYTVLSAGGGEEALTLAKDWKGPIHLLLTDMVMPGMSGRELASRLTSLYQDLKVLYISGYTHETIADHGIAAGTAAFLEKPLSSGVLTRKVREVLDQPGARSIKPGAKALVVDDEESQLQLVKTFLGSKGFSVFTATNMDDALEIVAREHPRIAVLDILLQGPSGLDLLERMKRESPEVGVIMTSSVEDEAVTAYALKVGASCYLRKPFRLEELEKAVRDLLAGGPAGAAG